jgi:uncharacterized membrane protein
MNAIDGIGRRVHELDRVWGGSGGGPRPVLRVLLGVFMIVAGVNHFVDPEFYLQFMPPYIPAHKLMVDVSGVAEIVLGVGLLIPHAGIVRLSAWGTIALLIAVFPANIHVYLNREDDLPGTRRTRCT